MYQSDEGVPDECIFVLQQVLNVGKRTRVTWDEWLGVVRKRAKMYDGLMTLQRL